MPSEAPIFERGAQILGPTVRLQSLEQGAPALGRRRRKEGSPPALARKNKGTPERERAGGREYRARALSPSPSARPLRRIPRSYLYLLSRQDAAREAVRGREGEKKDVFLLHLFRDGRTPTGRAAGRERRARWENVSRKEEA